MCSCVLPSSGLTLSLRGLRATMVDSPGLVAPPSHFKGTAVGDQSTCSFTGLSRSQSWGGTHMSTRFMEGGFPGVVRR